MKTMDDVLDFLLRKAIEIALERREEENEKIISEHIDSGNGSSGYPNTTSLGNSK